MEIETVTIFKSWVEIASILTDEDRGRLYHALCLYSLYDQEPDLDSRLTAFFTLMRPTIDKSNKRKLAQQKGLQSRLQNDLQNTEELQPPPKSTPAKKKNPVKSFSVMLPDHLQCSDVDVKWKEWEDFRRKKGKPISEAAAKKQMKMLQDLSREEAIAAIDNSIANDYQGLFPARRTKTKKAKDYTGL